MKLGNYKAFVYPFPPNNDTLRNVDSIIVVKGSLITLHSIFGRWKKYIVMLLLIVVNFGVKNSIKLFPRYLKSPHCIITRQSKRECFVQ
jgi:hypothetical protein